MNFLNKYANKKLIFMTGTILTGILTVFYLWLALFASGGSSLSSIASILSMLKFMVIAFYVVAIVVICNAVLAGFYYFKKNKEIFVLIEFIAFAIMGVLCLLAIPGMHALFKFSGATSLFTLASTDFTAMESAFHFLDYICYVGIVTFIYNIVMILISKQVIKTNTNFSIEDGVGAQYNPTTVQPGQPVQQQAQFDPMTGQPVTPVQPQQTQNDPNAGQYNQTAQQGAYNQGPVQQPGQYNQGPVQQGPNKSVLDSIKGFISTRNGKIVICAVLAVILAFGGYKMFSGSSKTTIDLSKNMQVEFSGNSGDGTAKVKNNDIEYDESDEELSKFISSIYYNYSDQYTLKNGDKMTVTVRYSKTEAERLGIEVTGETKSFTVKGLTERYDSASKVPDKLYTRVTELAKQQAAKDYAQDENHTYQYNQDSVYFAKSSNSYGSDSIMVVYKVTETYQFFGDPHTETYYECFEVRGIDSDSLTDMVKNEPTLYGLKLYDGSFNVISDPAKIEEGLKQKKTNATFSKFEK